MRILGGGDNKLIALIDNASAGALLSLGIFDLFEARHELIRLGEKLVKNLGQRLRGLNRATRTERLYAAHAVVMITAYFEALDEALTALGLNDRLDLSAADRISLASGRQVRGGWADFVTALATAPTTEPSIFNTVFAEQRYTALHQATVNYIRGLAAWDTLDETAQDRIDGAARAVVIRTAMAKYQEHVRRLAVDCPEFGIWLNLRAHEQTRAEVQRGLSGLAGLLQSANDENLAKTHSSLSRIYQDALTKPITGDADPELRVPTLAEGYLDHRFRVSPPGYTTRPSDEAWWQEHPVEDDLQHFLAAYLISREAHTAPLLILGQPGSGKSVLTRILAARLPADSFLPIRVELRSVPADDTIQAQIETAISMATGKTANWTQLVESAPEALPVVLLDGFDELLQATGVSQTNFLKRVAEFQEREEILGRPVAVIVTSRIVVADRATIPHDSAVLHLEPFDEAQIRAWLDVWNTTSGSSSLPLSDATVLHYRELAEQPLLLLMLALYNASTGRLSDYFVRLDRTEIYEKLLKEFARRELMKDDDETDLDQRIERELGRLSIVAFAMFNRGAQWVDEPGLSADLTALDFHPLSSEPRGLRAPLTPGQLVVGRFFFIHHLQATRDGEQLQTYEFLHATFSEYLVARLVVRLLEDTARREALSTFALPTAIDDGLLHALLSFECLAARAPIVEFLRSLIERLAPGIRRTAVDILLKLHRTALDARTDSKHVGYVPAPLNVVERHAAWSANLVLLTVIAAGEVTGSQLLGDSPGTVWRRRALMWRGQLSGEGWRGLVGALALTRTDLADGRRDVRLTLDDGTFEPAVPDIVYKYRAQASDPVNAIDLGVATATRLRKTNFTLGKSEDLLTHAVLPIYQAFPSLANVMYRMADDRWVSAAHALVRSAIAPHTDDHPAYGDLSEIIQYFPEPSPGSEEDLYLRTALGILLSAAMQGTAIPGEAIAKIGTHYLSTQAAQLLYRLLDLLPEPASASPTPPTPPKSAASPPPSPSPTKSSPETPAKPPAAP